MFVTFEGIEGAGKSTLIGEVAAALRREGRDVVVTREPGGTALGKRIREILLHEQMVAPLPIAELLLFSADRAHHVSEVIRPAREKRQTILCDRFTLSTLAYQGYGRGVPIADLEAVNRIATGGLSPDLTFLLDIEVTTGLERARGREFDRFEALDRQFHEEVRRGFLELARDPKRQVVILSGTEPIHELCATVVQRIESFPSK